MSCISQNVKKAFTGLLFVVSLVFSQSTIAADGEAIFKAKCIACHKPDIDATGPALKGARERQVSAGLSADWVYKWVANSTSMVSTDPYAKALKAKYGSVMTPYPESQVSKADIDAVLDWANKYTPPAPVSGTGGTGGNEDHSLLYGILTLILAVVIFTLLQINSNLRKLSEEKDGVLHGEPVPFYRNKSYLMIGVLAIAALAGYFFMEAAIGTGRQQNYQPEQPIFYSHKVHAGTNQISCLYCHGGAQDSKSANIPSVNVCMNCHKGIKEYAKESEPLVRENGVSVNGTAEIQKLYRYAGWNPDTKSYNPDNNGDGIPDGAKEIIWTKVHNLPDHVYFNHSQHIKVGKQQCQTCHGNIQEMPEVYQFSPLSMGWCINCHRESKVDFFNKADSTGNKFYSIYEKFHKDLKSGKMDSVTVENIGGTECQKCHY
jgi:Cytochrome c7 and related cytochrome c/Cytochrome c